MKEEYFLNQDHDCVLIPTRFSESLLVKNYLNEFKTQELKELALYNLGVLAKLEQLKSIIDAKVIDVGAVTWDLAPTEGHTESTLSSDVIYRLFQNYYTSQEVLELILLLYHRFVEEQVKVDDELTDTSHAITGRAINAAINGVLELLETSIQELVGTNEDTENNTINGLKNSINSLSEEILQILQILDNQEEDEGGGISEEQLLPIINDISTISLLIELLIEYKTSSSNTILLLTEYKTSSNLRIQQLENKQDIPHVVLTESEYEALQLYDEGTIYLIIENNEWSFGDDFPIVLI